MKCPQCGYTDEFESIEAPLPPGPPVPHGIQAIKKTFGEPGKVSMGKVTVWGKFGSKTFYCHEKIQPRLQWVFDELKLSGCSKDAIKTFDGCYNNRAKRGGAEKSTHAWAIAVDINCATNTRAPGDQHPKLVDLMTRAGFVQLRHDPMHFQYCTGY